jgi:hypothetical protein
MVQKASIGKGGITVFTCPHCARTKLVDTSQFAKFEQRVVRIKLTCECKEAYFVDLDRRLSPRKDVNLSGSYCHFSFGDGELGLRIHNAQVAIKNISKTGMRFELPEAPPLSPGDVIKVGIQLDETNQLVVEKEVEIKHISHSTVGAKFTHVSENDSFHRAIAFFLL